MTGLDWRRAIYGPFKVPRIVLQLSNSGYEGDIDKPAAAQPQLTGDVALRTPCIGMRTLR